MTRELTRATQLNENTTQEEIDDAIKTFAPMVVESLDAKRAIGKNFSEEWPYTPYIAVFFRTTDQIYDSRVRKTLFGFYQETILRTYDDIDKISRKYEFGKMAYELSQSFESENLEVIAYTGRFRQ